MNRRLFTLLVTMLALSAMLVSAGAVAAMPPLSFSSNIRVQNIEDQEANIVISFYDLDGDGEPVQHLHDKIAARSDAIYWTVDVSGLGQGWSGSAVVGSDREIRVVNNLYTEDWMFQGSSQGYLNGAYEVGIPLIQLSNKDWDSWFNVQNVGPEEARVYVVFEPVAGRRQRLGLSLPPFVSYTFDRARAGHSPAGPNAGGADRDRQAFVGRPRCTARAARWWPPASRAATQPDGL